jgi:peptidoglycan hydrolase CwlO-like protein
MNEDKTITELQNQVESLKNVVTKMFQWLDDCDEHIKKLEKQHDILRGRCSELEIENKNLKREGRWEDFLLIEDLREQLRQITEKN